MKGVLISEIPRKGLRTPVGPWKTLREPLNEGHGMLYVMEFLGYPLKPTNNTMNDGTTTVIGFLEMCIC